MKIVIIFCSKSGNTRKVAQAIASGIRGEVDLIDLDLSPEGIIWSTRIQTSFTLDLGVYDLVFLGGWATLMKIHPYLVAYIKKCKNIEDKRVYGFFTAGAIFSLGHVRENLEKVLKARDIHMIECFCVTTLLGLTLTRRKLDRAKNFGKRVSLQEGQKILKAVAVTCLPAFER
ncbi:MAG: flavodoxin family protein [bacterium]